MTTSAVGSVVLHGVPWKTYECLTELDSPGTRLTYDNGDLGIVSPTPAHEKRNRRLSSFVETMADAWNMDIENFGSATFRLTEVVRGTELVRGTEPDSCFYVQRLAAVAGRDEINLDAGDPAPDLVIEVDVTSGSLDKLPIYAKFGVSEIWRSSGNTVSLLLLTEDGYVEAERSAAFPLLSAATLNTFVARGATLSRLTWLREVRTWAEAQLRPNETEGVPV